MFYMNFFLSVSRNMESVCLSDGGFVSYRAGSDITSVWSLRRCSCICEQFLFVRLTVWNCCSCEVCCCMKKQFQVSTGEWCFRLWLVVGCCEHDGLRVSSFNTNLWPLRPPHIPPFFPCPPTIRPLPVSLSVTTSPPSRRLSCHQCRFHPRRSGHRPLHP